MTVVLGLVGAGAVRWMVSELAQEGAERSAVALAVFALVGLGGSAGAAFLVGASDATGRWWEQERS